MQKPERRQGRIAKFDSKFRKFTCAQAVAVGEMIYDLFDRPGYSTI